MANNVNIATKSTGQQHTAAELNLQVGWMNEPSQSLGTFNPAMTFDSQGTYSDYTLTENITITATGIKNGNERKVKITGNGSNTVAIGSGCDLIKGSVGTLQSGVHIFYMKSFAGVVDIGVINTNQSQLSPPTNFVMSATDGGINWSWSASQGATGYTAEYALASAPNNWMTVSEHDGTSTNITQTGLTNGIQYLGRVKAIGSGYSDSFWVQSNATPSASVTQLTAISDLAASPGNSSASLTFTNPNSGNEDDNLVQYSTDNFSADIQNGITIASGGTGGTQTGLTNGTLYYFRIISRGSGSYSNSDASNIDSATPSGASYTSFDGLTNYLWCGDVLDSLFSANDVYFALSLTVQNWSGNTVRLISKTLTGTVNGFHLFFSATTGLTFAFGNGTDFVIVNYNTAQTINNGDIIRVNYNGSIDTNNGIDRVTILINGVEASGTKQRAAWGGTFPFAIGNNTVSLAVGDLVDGLGSNNGSAMFDGDAKDFKVYSAGGIELDIPVLSIGTDISGNGYNGTFV